jgi:hypothetical protein
MHRTRNEIVKHHQGLSTLANVFVESSYEGSMLLYQFVKVSFEISRDVREMVEGELAAIDSRD